MKPIQEVKSRTAVLADENIDTDRIIPARFLTTTENTALGEHCFEDWRYLPDGTHNPDFPLNKPEASQCTILVAGRNFGCGSSREHAPWALLEYGIRAVISNEIADIFRNNALKNGLLALVVDDDAHKFLLNNPGTLTTINLAEQTITIGNLRTVSFTIDSFTKHCLMQGIDQMGFLLQNAQKISEYEQKKKGQFI
ncbi:3-isopropylmalate dehydratase small subunit [Entomobacter blattae]|uniref:3-isopropylmalate dehydratase small subunit n=1 Tax=Entomobacter blattae TaxID=2762277 RepID=A0A7H1NNT4_9PROT|nr:3-isopropylmalate dehydratase small subunit [Entomobacter blattae]QNT77444.1 3-isopropylmalate dehydratase small subunit [Entomobacter blattae]